MASIKKTVKTKKSVAVVSVDKHNKLKEAFNNNIETLSKAAVKLLASEKKCKSLELSLGLAEVKLEAAKDFFLDHKELTQERKVIADAEIDELNETILELKAVIATSLDFSKMLLNITEDQ
tara:strand:- start:141 stop:503 length:363 start_codon:yes stop_codon:yes gene_type:complete